MISFELSSLKSGFLARVTKINNISCSKDLKQLMNMGIVKGNIIEVTNNNTNLLLLKKENATFGISKQLAKNIFVTIL